MSEEHAQIELALVGTSGLQHAQLRGRLRTAKS